MQLLQAHHCVCTGSQTTVISKYTHRCMHNSGTEAEADKHMVLYIGPLHYVLSRRDLCTWIAESTFATADKCLGNSSVDFIAPNSVAACLTCVKASSLWVSHCHCCYICSIYSLEFTNALHISLTLMDLWHGQMSLCCYIYGSLHCCSH